jgi:hypothetical protein
MSAYGNHFSVVAAGPQDRVLLGPYRRRVQAIRTSGFLNRELFENWLEQLRRAEPDCTRIVVPSNEFLNSFLLTLDRDALLRNFNCEIPLVDSGLYARLTNKTSAAALFAGAGIRVPAELRGFDRDALPMVAKPRANVGRDGAIKYPQLLRSREDLDAFLASQNADDYFAQEFIGGESHYLLMYISRDAQVFLSAQRNLAQQPGGKSIVLAETCTFARDEVAGKTVSLLQGLGFHGFAMVEFIVDGRGPCFIEVNPRPWGPLQLCADHACGIVEAFVGEYAHDDSRYYERAWSQKPAQARFMWLGGMRETARQGRSLDWKLGTGESRLIEFLRGLPSDVYLRRDTWRGFLKELIHR